jgi:sigma-E factor negative regulatory protein RseC
MGRENEVTHEGIVVSSGEGSVTVMISRQESCIGCQAANICNLTNLENKTIKIDGDFNLSPGTRVIVSISQKQGFFALLLGYILPLIILITSILILASLSAGELLTGLISIGLTALYYFLLYLSGGVVSKKFSFRLKTI